MMGGNDRNEFDRRQCPAGDRRIAEILADGDAERETAID